MKFLHGLLLSLTAFSTVGAQALPSCASKCLATYVPASGCTQTDFKCICSNVPLLTDVQTCVLGTCTIKEALATKNATSTMCGLPVRDITNITPIITAVSGGVAIVAVGLRLVDSATRGWMFTWADGCVVLSLSCAIVMGILEFIMSHDGFGKDVWAVEFDNITRIIKFTWLTEMLYMTSLGLTKTAIFLFYLQIFAFPRFKQICYVSIGLCLLYIPAFTLPIVFECSPVDFTWLGWAGESTGKCINFNAFAWSHAIINIVLDVYIIVVPIPMIMGLNMGKKKRYQLALMFLLGVFITIVSIIRLKSLVEFATTTNATYDNVPTAYWSVLEAYVSIICCCLPALRSLARRYAPSLALTTRNATNNKYSSSNSSGSNPKTWGLNNNNNNNNSSNHQSGVFSSHDNSHKSSRFGIRSLISSSNNRTRHPLSSNPGTAHGPEAVEDVELGTRGGGDFGDGGDGNGNGNGVGGKNGGIKKSVTHSVSVVTQDGSSDTFELVDKTDHDRRSGW